MRLKLVAETPTEPADEGWRLLEQGELTLGSAAGCGWRLAGREAAVSPIHCRILRDGAGFLLRDESLAGVSVDGTDLMEGETVRLTNGASVAFAGLVFSVEITGEAEAVLADPDPGLPFGDDAPSITSILSDVAPGGQTAGWLLPGRAGDDWFDANGVGEGSGRTHPKTAEVGWSGPPEPEALSPILPADWDDGSDVASRTEHVSAVSIRIRAPKTETPELSSTAAPGEAEGETLLSTILDGWRFAQPPVDDPATFLRSAGAAMRDAADRLSVLEAEAADFLADQGLERPAPTGGSDPRDLAARLDRMIEHQRRLHQAIEAAFEDLARRFDPRGIEARVDAGGRKVLRMSAFAERGYWHAFRETWGSDGTATVRTAFRAALGGAQELDTDDGFEELSADVPLHGERR